MFEVGNRAIPAFWRKTMRMCKILMGSAVIMSALALPAMADDMTTKPGMMTMVGPDGKMATMKDEKMPDGKMMSGDMMMTK